MPIIKNAAISRALLLLLYIIVIVAMLERGLVMKFDSSIKEIDTISSKVKNDSVLYAQMSYEESTLSK